MWGSRARSVAQSGHGRRETSHPAGSVRRFERLSSDQRRFTIGSSEALSSAPRPSLMGSGRCCIFRAVSMEPRLDPDALVTAADIARLIPSVSRHLVYVWHG